MIIDVHSHVVPPSLLTRLRDDSRRHGVSLRDSGQAEHVVMGDLAARPFLPHLSAVKDRLQVMEESGIDIQVLSSWVELFGYDLPLADAERFVRLQNETMAQLVADYPDRFVGMATVPLQDGDAASRVLVEAAEEFGLKAVQIGTQAAGRNLDDPGLEPFWETAEEMDVFILVHPLQSQVAGGERLKRYYFANLLGNPWETTIAGASLIFGGVLQRHPRLKVCLAHGGGFLPYQLGRLSKGYRVRPEAREHLTELPVASFQRLFMDTILHDRGSLAHLIRLMGSDRILLGSDHPFDMAEDDPVAAVNGISDLSGADRRKILGETAGRLLHLPA